MDELGHVGEMSSAVFKLTSVSQVAADPISHPGMWTKIKRNIVGRRAFAAGLLRGISVGQLYVLVAGVDIVALEFGLSQILEETSSNGDGELGVRKDKAEW